MAVDRKESYGGRADPGTVGGGADEDVRGAQPGEADDEQREGVAPEPGEPLDGGALHPRQGNSPPHK